MIDNFWQQYLNKNMLGDIQYKTAFQFGADGDHLASLVIRGIKQATSSLHCLYAQYGHDLPTAGSHHIVLDSNSYPIAIIKITDVQVIEFGQVTEAMAKLEGEGSYSMWKVAHQKFFESQVTDLNIEITPETKIVFEQFECVHRP